MFMRQYLRGYLGTGVLVVGKVNFRDRRFAGVKFGKAFS
jgi:hypothetical protein